MSNNVGEIVYDVQMNVRQLIEGQQQVNDRMDRMERSADGASKSFSKLSGVAAALGGILSAKKIAEYAEAWTVLNNKLVNSIKIGENLAQVNERVFKIAQDSRSSIDGVATLYSRLERATREAGVSGAELAGITTTITKAMAVSGATAAESEGALIQLSQALASGVLRGQEFNSMSEQAPALMKGLANSLGVGIGQLRKMAGEGKLTTDVLLKAFKDMGPTIEKEFSNTVATIGQSLEVANNNITKFIGESVTVKATVSAFNSVVVTLSESLDSLSIPIIGLAAVMGGRLVGALVAATTAKINNVMASRSLLTAELETAQAQVYATNVTVRKTLADKEQAQLAVAVAQAEYAAARGSMAEMTAIQNLTVAKTTLIRASAAHTQATIAESAAIARTTAAANAASFSFKRLATSALGMVGGIGGVATILMVVAGAALYYQQATEQARKESIAFADNLNELTEALDLYNQAQLESNQAKLLNSIDAQRAAIKGLEEELSIVQSRLRLHAEAESSMTEETYANILTVEKQTELQRRQKILLGEISDANDKVAKSVAVATKVQDTFNQKFSWAASVTKALADGFKTLDKSLPKPSTAQVDKLTESIGELNDKLEVSKLEAKGQTKQAAMLAEAQKIAAGAAIEHRDNILALAGGLSIAALNQSGMTDEVRAFYQQVQTALQLTGQLAEAKESKKGGGGKDDQGAEAIKQLKEQIATAKLEMQGFTRESEILSAVQGLGEKATEAQKNEVRALAGALYDAKLAQSDLNDAIAADPTKAATQAREQAIAQLKRQIDGEMVDFEQGERRKLEITEEYNRAIAEARAKSVVSPRQESAAMVDPVQALANENAQKLALIQQFEASKTITEKQGIALRNAANKEYDTQRTAAMWQLWQQQSIVNEALGGAFDSIGSAASNALTGIITGSMSASDALMSISSTILNSVINTFVQMGIEQAKAAIMGASVQNSAIATTTAAQTAGLATTTAASTASAATTTASWAPAATVASIGSFGGAAAIGLGALLAAFAVGSALSGKRKNGGPVSAGGMYQVGEGGAPEIFKAGNRQYMIPGDNGSVISNKDIQGGGGGSAGINVSVNINNTNGSFVDQQVMSDGAGGVSIDIIVADMDNGGPISQSIMRNTTATRRANQ